MSKALAGLILGFGLASVPIPVLAADVREIHRTVALDAHGTVSIRTFKGSVDVEPWDTPGAEVSARVEADTSCGSDAYQAERVRLTEVDFESTSTRLEVRSNYEKLDPLPSIPFHAPGFDATCSAHPFIHYRLRIPRTARLDIEDHKSRIEVSGLRSDAKISTHKGNVHVKAHDGAIELTTHKGNVHVEFARLGGDSRLETYKGDIEISVPRAAGFDLDARVERGGMLTAAFPLDEQIVDRRERVYEQKVNGGGPRLELSTRNGSIQIK
jgi:putative adhesin